MAAQVRTKGPNDIADLEAESAIMLQATNCGDGWAALASRPRSRPSGWSPSWAT